MNFFSERSLWIVFFTNRVSIEHGMADYYTYSEREGVPKSVFDAIL
jgi:hypothetical protein